MNPQTAEAKKIAQATAAKYLRQAFNNPATTPDECVQITEASIFYDLPGTDEMIDDLEGIVGGIQEARLAIRK